jgi:hypothetical protein
MRSTSAAPFSKWARRAHNAGSIASRMAIVALVLAGFASVACADDDLPARVGRVSDFGGSSTCRRRIVPTTGRRLASTIR